jgi:glycosyltransferase involved in cell wall biosynthesis
MRVSVLPGDNGGCGNLRLKWPAEAVRGIRPDWDITVHKPRGDVVVGVDRSGKVVEVQLDPLPDLLVMQRTGTPVLAGVAEWMQARGVAIVADFDDAMWCIDRDNIAFATWNTHSQRGKRQHWSWCDWVSRRADLVTVTTEGLARRYGSHGRVEVIPNGVPQVALEAPSWRDRYPDTPTVGWVGYTATHPGDCSVSRPAVHAAIGAGGTARVVADADGASREWDAHVESIPPQDGLDYYSAVSAIDVMLVGLKSSPFNECKSYLKVLEAGAVGTPSIATATRPHRSLQQSGFPVTLASSPQDWRGEAIRLVQDTVYRKERAEEVREAMPARTIEARAEEWACAWERAVRRAKR